MGLGIPPLEIKIMLESDPLKPTMLVERLGVCWWRHLLVSVCARNPGSRNSPAEETTNNMTNTEQLENNAEQSRSPETQSNMNMQQQHIKHRGEGT